MSETPRRFIQRSHRPPDQLAADAVGVVEGWVRMVDHDLRNMGHELSDTARRLGRQEVVKDLRMLKQSVQALGERLEVLGHG